MDVRQAEFFKLKENNCPMIEIAAEKMFGFPLGGPNWIFEGNF